MLNKYLLNDIPEIDSTSSLRLKEVHNLTRKEQGYDDYDYIKSNEINELKSDGFNKDDNNNIEDNSIDKVQEEINDFQEDFMNVPMKNYLNTENIYINEGKLNAGIQSLSSYRSNTYGFQSPMSPINENNDNRNNNNNYYVKSISSLHSDSYFDKNEIKLKRLQELIENKIRSEFEVELKKNEKEIEEKTKNEFDLHQ